MQSELSHLGVCSQLSEHAKSKLLQTAPHRQLAAGEVLYPCIGEDTPAHGDIDAFVIILCGRLDVFWDGDEETFQEFVGDAEENDLTAPDQSEAGLTPAATAAAEQMRQEEFSRLRKTPLATIRRGQTFGDQMLGLALDKCYAGSQLASRTIPIRVVAGDAGTEIIWITKAFYEDHLREDRVSLSYHPLSSSASSNRFADAFRNWVPGFFARKDILDRDPSDLGDISRRMLADSKLSKLLFQFPPLVVERMCHAMQLRHYDAYGQFLGDGDEIAHIYIVVHGALRMMLAPSSSEQSSSDSPLTSAMPAPGSQAEAAGQDALEQFVPGDVFGAVELVERRASKVVYVEADTLLLAVPRVVFERWLAPLYLDTIFNPGSSFQRLENLSHTSGRLLHGDKRAKLSTSPIRRQSVVLASTDMSDGQHETRHALELDDVANLLKKMGLFPLIPRFVLGEMLQHVSVAHKQAGDVLFHEGERSQHLVVILTGFLSFYSLEHLSTTTEMFQKHSFCQYRGFRGSQTNPEDFVANGIADESTNRAAVLAKHRSVMHGVHIQTLPARNAFRTGILLEGTRCPATVVAQTNCECLILDETAYLQLLKLHSPVIDLSKLDPPLATGEPTAAANPESTSNKMCFPPGSLHSTVAQRSPMVLHPAVMAFLEHTTLPWLTRSPLKMQQLLLGMRYISVAPGERLVRCNDVLDHLIIVVSGKLALHISQNEDVSSMLESSQRSVRSLMLEHCLISNYSTTSQQLYKEAEGAHRGRVGSRQDAFTKRKMILNKITRISGATGGSGLFMDSVLAAVQEERLQRAGEVVAAANEAPDPKNGSRERRPSRSSLLLHAAVSKAKLQQKLDVRRGARRASAMLGHDGAGLGSLFLCHLGPGEVYGDEILASHGSFRSVHDVVVDIAAPNAATSPAAPTGAQLLLLDRHIFHSIASKSDADIEKEMKVRSKHAKIKWHHAEQKITQKLSRMAIGETGKTQKLFDLFKNILNQRCLLTMRAIADIPLLRGLPDSSKRELCLAARFEALERHTNAYKENGASISGPRYYFLLSGRIGLYAKTLNSSFFSHGGGNNSSAGTNSAAAMAGTENCLREVLVGDGFGEFEILVPDFSRTITALALEPCRLLSFPANMFLKHWPRVSEMKGDIEYLRNRVPFFSRLELEKIANLYHTLSFQTFTRGSSK